MTTRPTHEPSDPDDPAQDDLDRAELVESAGLQNTWAVIGPAALLAIPLTWALVALKKLFTRTPNP